MKVNKGTWVQIHQIVLTPEERAPQVPDDTKRVPLELWVKGILQHDSNIGENAEIITMTGRKTQGTLVQENPPYVHSFGDFVPELLKIDMQLRDLLFGGEKDE